MASSGGDPDREGGTANPLFRDGSADMEARGPTEDSEMRGLIMEMDEETAAQASQLGGESVIFDIK